MILTLDITGPDAPQRGATTRKELRARGGTIGRQPGSSLELEDPHVSRDHALIQFERGIFYLEDKSQAGTYLNSLDNRLEKGRRYPLTSGDLILIDPYEIRVSIAPVESAVPAPRSPLGGAPSAHDPFGPLTDLAAPGGTDSPDDQFGGAGVVDPLIALGLEEPKPKGGSKVSLEQGAPEREQYVPPAFSEHRPTPPGGLQIPSDYDPLRSTGIVRPAPPGNARPVPPAPAAPAAPTPQPRGEARARPKPQPDPLAGGVGGADLAAVLVGAGLRPEDVTPQLAQDFGRILRVVVQGVMDLLQARQEVRIALVGPGRTNFKPAGNNPLKFSANVEDALHNLLVKRNAAYLAPVEAFEEAFTDVRHHQVAMLAGVRVAFESMLAQFEPDALQGQFDKQKKGALVSKPANLRYWDQYRDWIRDMVRDADGSFRTLFGDEFADAYEAQLKALKAEGRSREP